MTDRAGDILDQLIWGRSPQAIMTDLRISRAEFDAAILFLSDQGYIEEDEEHDCWCSTGRHRVPRVAPQPLWQLD